MSDGCNSSSAQYQVKENLLSFGEINRTLMACEQPGIGQQEQDYLQALESAGRFELAGDHLTIRLRRTDDNNGSYPPTEFTQWRRPSQRWTPFGSRFHPLLHPRIHPLIV